MWDIWLNAESNNHDILDMKTTPRDLKSDRVSPATPAAPAKRSRRSRPPAQSPATDGWEQINLHAAGIDVGSAENFVCVPASAVKAGEASVRSFKVFTADHKGVS
jgi:hypothetical protein